MRQPQDRAPLLRERLLLDAALLLAAPAPPSAPRRCCPCPTALPERGAGLSVVVSLLCFEERGTVRCSSTFLG